MSQVITRIVVSLLFGGVAYVMTQALQSREDVNVILGVGVSVFISGVAFVIQFLLEVDHGLVSLGQNVQSMGESYRAELAKVSKATELFGLVEASALKTDAVTQLVRNATSIEQTKPSLIADFAQAEMIRLSNYLRDLGQRADVTYDGEDRDWLLGLAKAASVSIDATSLTTVDAGGRGFVDGGLWSSDLGQRYLEAQKDAIGRGVAIRRIFILDRPELRRHPELLGILKDHHDIKVEVRTLDPSEVSGIMRSLLIDFIVVDDTVVYQSTTVFASNPESRPRIISTRLVTDPDRVAKDSDRYKVLWEAAAPFVPPTSVDGEIVIPHQTIR